MSLHPDAPRASPVPRPKAHGDSGRGRFLRESWRLGLGGLVPQLAPFGICHLPRVVRLCQRRSGDPQACRFTPDDPCTYQDGCITTYGVQLDTVFLARPLGRHLLFESSVPETSFELRELPIRTMNYSKTCHVYTNYRLKFVDTDGVPGSNFRLALSTVPEDRRLYQVYPKHRK